MATTFRPRRLSAENTAENRDHEFGALKTQWSAAARKSARMPFGALDPNSSVSYPGGAGVKKARKAAVKKPFVKPPLVLLVRSLQALRPPSRRATGLQQPSNSPLHARLEGRRARDPARLAKPLRAVEYVSP